ncbi:hypothetical protein N7452_008279 [Penicillium brevicompactum]|uniref:Uncharacterized protein n=1 Tax=Penicillium brevicompactum TaxID=5074 RepID=A0A9W9UA31_PENBR|nr:hypothetical protein N7452_008279 [Penicillium brevicompactum]
MPPPTPDSPHNVQSPTMIYHTDNMDIKWSQFQSLSHELQSERSRMKLELETMKRTLRERETELQDCREQILRTVSTFQVSDSSILDELVKIRDSLCNLILVLPDITGFDQTWRTVHSTMIEKDSASRMKITLKPEGRLDIIQAELIEHDIFYLVWNTLLRPTLAGLPDQQQLFWAKILEQRAKMEPLQGKRSTIG